MVDNPHDDNTLDAPLEEEHEDNTPAHTDDDSIVIPRELVTNIATALIFLLLGFVLGGLFGTGILVSNSDAVASALVNNAPALAQQPSGQQPQQPAQAPPQPTQPPAVLDNVSADDDPSFGPADAPVTIIEFSDFRCGFCGRFYEQTLPLIREEYGDQVRFVYRDFLAVGGIAQAQAAECADEQGEFWAYHDALFANQGQHNTTDDLIGLAETLNLNQEAFEQCLENGDTREEVVADNAAGQQYGVTGTPTFFINGRRLVGAQPFSAFQQVIDQALAEADAGSGDNTR